MKPMKFTPETRASVHASLDILLGVVNPDKFGTAANKYRLIESEGKPYTAEDESRRCRR